MSFQLLNYFFIRLFSIVPKASFLFIICFIFFSFSQLKNKTNVTLISRENPFRATEKIEFSSVSLKKFFFYMSSFEFFLPLCATPK
jgi:hypothetical protein